MTDYINMPIPCETDPITLASLVTFAQQADAGLLTLNTQASRALFKPFVAAQSNGPAAAGPGVNTPLTFNTPLPAFNAFGMFNPAVPNQFTVPENGSYLISYICTFTTATTVTSQRGAILANGVEIVAERWIGVTNGGASFELSGIGLAMVAGQTIQMTKAFTGTGTSNFSADNVYIVKISDS